MPRHAGIVRHQDDREAVLAVQLLEHPQNFLAGLRVEVAGRLVGQQDAGWLISERAIATRCCSPPGKLRRLVIHPVGEADPLQQFGGPLGHLVFGEVLVGVRQRHHDVFQRRCARQQVEGLKNEPDGFLADPRPFPGGRAGKFPGRPTSTRPQVG